MWFVCFLNVYPFHNFFIGLYSFVVMFTYRQIYVFTCGCLFVIPISTLEKSLIDQK